MFRRFLLFSLLSLCVASASWAASKIDYRYWFDNDSIATNNGHSAANAWQMEVDVSGLTEAIHTIHLQAIDKDGVASTPVTRYFLKTSLADKPVKVVYCVDDDLTPLATSTVTNGTVLLDVSKLPDGFHFLHVQAVGSKISSTKTYCFIKTPIKDPNVQLNCLCWIDGNLYKNEKMPAAGGIISWELDVTELPQGMHYIQVQAVSDDGVPSKVYQSFFLRVPTTEESGNLTCICWIDGKIFKQEKLSAQGGLIHWQLDVKELPQGLHYAQIQVMDDNGIASRNYQSFFLREPTTEERGSLNCICWIDGEIFKQEKLPIQGGVLNWNIDVIDIPQGLHHVQVLAQDDNGTSSRIYQSFFLRVPTAAEEGNLNCYYDIDGEDSHQLATNMVDGKYHFDIDVSNLEDGPHRLSCMLTNDNGDGSSSRIFNRYFIKIPVGGYGVKRYCYWLNDSMSQAVNVVLDNPVDPFKLITLLPFDHWPIRSSSFEFKIEDNQPVIYARNDIHVYFFDSSDRFIDISRSFTDPSIKQAVTDITLIEPGETKTAPRPQENEILWYKVEALHGDSLSFKADRPCTIQVFSPKGEELRSASADKSVQWSGVHAPIDGTYYIAQHDMTASQGNTLSISYQHIDQYAILDYDVHTVGNGGASTITFNGNGFDDLYEIDLLSQNGDSIHHVELVHTSNSNLSATFDFLEATIGSYDAIFYFVEGSFRIDDFLKVEEAQDIELDLNVSYPNSYLVGNPVTYTINVLNKSNMTAYAVPLEIELLIDSRSNISYLLMDGFVNHLSVPQELLYDSLEVDVVNEIESIIAEKGDKCQFIFVYDSISNMDCGLSQVIMTIPPNSSKQFTITITTTSTVTINASISSEWSPFSIEKQNNYHRVRAMAPSRGREWMCCYRERFECVGGAISTVVGIAGSPVAGCATELVIDGLSTVFDVWCSNGNNLNERWDNYLKSQGQSLASRAIQSAVSCVTAYFRFLYKNLWNDRNLARALGNEMEVDRITSEMIALRKMESSLLRDIYEGVTNAILGGECYKAFREKKPNCPPKKKDGGGSSTPRRSCEPNDMLGYNAPSGSHYIGNGLTDVYYTIQFENDSAATSPANVIILTDTIDARYFDLNSFAPTRVKIGDVEAPLSGEPNFVQTVDMRPRINCIAQVECNYNSQKGIAVFTLTSLDPMTLEKVTDYNQGMLPPNGADNQGQGEMSFNISLKPGLPEGTVIKNHADNIFDTEDPVFTPDWVNIIDGVKPTSRVIGCELLNDSVAAVSIRGEDDRSGPWRYDIYTQYGGGDWVKAASEVPIDHAAQVRVYEGIEHHFYAVLTDSADNVEAKQPVCELTFDYFSSDTESNLTLNLARGWNWMSHNLNTPLSIDCLKPNAHRILSHDGETINDPRYGYTGNVSQMSPTELYKVEMSASDNIPLSGLLFNSALKPIPLVQGWNWMGYPMPGAMSVNEALVLLEADENDCIVGQDGSAVYNDGLWRGTLTTLEPGKGYLLKVNNDKSLRFNASRSSVRLHAPAVTGQNEELPWTVDIHRYPNVTPIIADLWDGNTLTSSLGYALAAFVDDECRGIATEVNGRWMMNVFGNGGETVTFKALDRNTGLVHDVTETQSFTADLLGTMAMPVQLHIADGAGLNTVTYDDVNVKPTMTTGPVTIEASVAIDDVEVINMAGMTIMGYSNIPSGFTLDLSSEPDGVYLVKVHTGSHISTVKVMKRSR